MQVGGRLGLSMRIPAILKTGTFSPSDIHFFCNDDLSAFGSSMVALAPAATVMAWLTRRLSLM